MQVEGALDYSFKQLRVKGAAAAAGAPSLLGMAGAAAVATAPALVSFFCEQVSIAFGQVVRVAGS